MAAQEKVTEQLNQEESSSELKAPNDANPKRAVVDAEAAKLEHIPASMEYEHEVDHASKSVS